MHWTVELPTAADGYATVTTSGSFNVVDHRRMIDDIVGRPDWRPGTDALFDHRNLSFDQADLSTMYQAATNHLNEDARIGSGKAAIVMRSLGDFARGRQFEMLTEGRISATLHVFLDEAEAREWLAGRTA